jgi:hypothetical protein
MPFTFFYPEAHVTKTQGHLPHWDQESATYFITWRTADSLPKQLWDQWRAERATWLLQHGIDPNTATWRVDLESLTEPQRQEFARTFSAKLEAHLDAGHGACVVRDPAHARIMADALHHFDGDRYTLGDYVIMPNHVHLLVGGMQRETMLAQVESWKKWTAMQINRAIGSRGRFWQDESFDHLVRSADAFQKFRRYIAENPIKAKLREGEFIHWQRPAE